MSSNSTHEFPSPAGGIPLPIDFAPCILFAILHAIFVPVALWRLITPRSRTFVMIGTVLFVTERVVAYSLRVAISHSDSLRANIGLEVYLQTMLAGGFISMGSDLIGMVRSLLVGTTIGTRMRAHISLTPQHFRRGGTAAPSTTDASSDAIVLKDAQVTVGEAVRGEGVGEGEGSEGVAEVVEVEDYPEMRARIRSICGIGQLLFLVAVVLGIIAGVDYQSAAKSGEHAELVRRLWYGSNSLALVLLLALAFGTVFAYLKLPRVPRFSVIVVVTVSLLLCIVASYRIAILRFSTTSLTSTGPGSLNAPSSKAAFYVLHVLPEFTAAALLVSINVRETFATGRWGDNKTKDPVLGPDGKPVPKPTAKKGKSRWSWK